MYNTACKEGSVPECSWRECRTCTQDMPSCTLKDRFCADKGTLRCKSCAMNTRSLAYKVSTRVTCGFPELNTNDFQTKFLPGETGIDKEGKEWVMSPLG